MAKTNALALAVSAATKNRQTPASKATTATRQGRAKNPAYSTLSVYIPKELHTSVKVAALQRGEELSAIVETLLEGWVASASKSSR